MNHGRAFTWKRTLSANENEHRTSARQRSVKISYPALSLTISAMEGKKHYEGNGNHFISLEYFLKE